MKFLKNLEISNKLFVQSIMSLNILLLLEVKNYHLQKIPKKHPQLTFFLAIDKDGKLQLENLNEFGEKFLSNVWLQIDKKFPLQTSNSDPLVTEKEFHERFGETRLKCFVGRVDILNDLSDYINSSINSPLVLSGPNGIFSEFFSS